MENTTTKRTDRNAQHLLNGAGNRSSTRRLLIAGLIAVTASAAVNNVVAVVATAALHVPATFLPLSAGSVTSLTVVGVVLAVLVFGIVTRSSRRPMSIYLPLSAAALILSWIPDLGAFMGHVYPGATGADFAALASLHVTTAVVTISALRTLAVSRPDTIERQ